MLCSDKIKCNSINIMAASTASLSQQEGELQSKGENYSPQINIFVELSQMQDQMSLRNGQTDDIKAWDSLISMP